MTPERWQHIKEIFYSALACPVSDRASFIDSACADDEEARREVSQLIAAHQQSGEFLDLPAFELAARSLAGSKSAALAAGQIISHYKIIKLLGSGGMGEVYLAEDTSLRRKVALKLLPVSFTGESDRVRRFAQEACAASALNHPNVCTIHEVGEAEDRRHFIVMEYVDGLTLRTQMATRNMEVTELLDVATQIASGLEAAHAVGVVHRDVKPENVMLRADGIVKVLDFGLAKLTENQPTADSALSTQPLVHTETGMVMGTASYMSPEQARGLEVDHRTDIWSLGVVLYEMTAGRVPFEGATNSDVISNILKESPALAPLSDNADLRLDEIVTKALTKDREERYQSAKDFLTDLKRLKHRLDVKAEIERTTPSHVRSTKGRADESPVAAGNRSTVQTVTAEVARPTSSAEYIVTEIKRHKTSALFFAALAVVSVVASILFINDRGARELTEKDTILLADFVNTTGEPVFDGTLKQALAVQLGQSPYLNIFSEERVREALRFMGRLPDERVTRDVALEICQRQGLKSMLAGSIARLGNHYVITVEAINAQTGDAIAREQAEAESKEQVLRALGGMATRIRKDLGESLGSIQKFDAPIEQATTSSLEAFKAYSLGVQQHLKGKYLEAIPFYKRATELDPNFALAYARLAAVYYNSMQYGLAPEASAKAYDLRDRVSERERLFIVANYYDEVSREVEKKVETLELWKRTYPRDFVPYNNLALTYNNLGQFEKAVEEARAAIALNPKLAPAHSNLARALIGLNRLDEAKEVIDRALAQKIETTWMHRNLYLIAFVRGDAATMRQQIEWANGKLDQYAAQFWQAETAAFAGQLRRAREFSTRAAEIAQHRDLKEVVAEITAMAAGREAIFGNCKQAKEQSTKALAVVQNQFVRCVAADALGACGDFSETQAVTDEMLKRYPQDSLLNKNFLPLVQARAEMNRGNAARVIELLETTRPYEATFPFRSNYLRGEAYLSQQKGAEAAAEFQKILDHRGWQPASPLYALAHLGLARAAVLTGDTPRARKAYEDFFALWKDADADIRALRDARREYEKLR